MWGEECFCVGQFDLSVSETQTVKVTQITKIQKERGVPLAICLGSEVRH